MHIILSLLNIVLFTILCRALIIFIHIIIIICVTFVPRTDRLVWLTRTCVYICSCLSHSPPFPFYWFAWINESNFINECSAFVTNSKWYRDIKHLFVFRTCFMCAAQRGIGDHAQLYWLYWLMAVFDGYCIFFIAWFAVFLVHYWCVSKRVWMHGIWIWLNIIFFHTYNMSVDIICAQFLFHTVFFIRLT